MTFEEYLTWLDEYWNIFGPIPPRLTIINYKIIKF
jgi:hypothetical protein